MEHLQTIQQIFTARFLTVPDYQRGYAWERRHWDDLLEDLELLDVGAEHYTGTLVLHANDTVRITDEEGREHGCYDVVDGQQRITTIVILLDAIRRELTSNAILADGIKKTYILTRDLDGQPRPKLRLNRDTYLYFERNILADKPGIEGPQIRSHQLLRNAQLHLQTYVREGRKTHGDDGAWLVSLYRKVTNSLKLTVYEVPRASEVGVIFEVMNNRGKPLSEMEKVKNYLLYLASKTNTTPAQELGVRVNEAWRNIFEGLMACGASSSRYEDQLLRSHWLTVYDHRPKTWAGNDSIKQRFSLKKYQGDPDRLIADLGAYVDSLREFAVAYCDLIAPSRSDAFTEYRDQPQVQRSIQRAAEKLTRLDALATFIPLLGAVRLVYPGQANLLMDTLALCEKYAFRVYRWAGRRSNAGQTSLFKIGHELYHQTIQPKEALERIAAYLLYYAPADDFRRELDTPEDWYNRWHGLKYFLYEYEEHLAAGKTVQLPWDKLARADKKDTIEHILPQTPTEYWTQRWPNEDLRRCLHDIGNLVLTFDNSVYSNKSFPEKLGAPGQGACYANSNLFMERDLARYSDWTPTDCSKRRQEVVVWAAKRWDVPIPTAAAVDDVELLEEDDAGD